MKQQPKFKIGDELVYIKNNDFTCKITDVKLTYYEFDEYKNNKFVRKSDLAVETLEKYYNYKTKEKQPKFKKGDKLVYIGCFHEYEKCKWEAEILDVITKTNEYKINEINLINGKNYISNCDFITVEDVYKLKSAAPEYRYFTNVDRFFDSTLYIKYDIKEKKCILHLSDGSPIIKDDINLDFCLQCIENKTWKELTESEIQAKFGHLEYPAAQNTKNKEQKTNKMPKFTNKSTIFIAKPNSFYIKYKNKKGQIKDYTRVVPIEKFDDGFSGYVFGQQVKRFKNDGIVEIGEVE